MDEERMNMWLDHIWIPYTEKVQTELKFDKSFLTLDAFSAHKVDSVMEKMAENNVGSQEVPAGCTSKVQVLDVSLNRPFKSVLTECWEDYVVETTNTMTEAALNDPKFKLPSPPRQAIVDWVLKGYDYLVSKKEMVRRAFEVCGVVTTDPSKVRNDEFHVNIMKEVVDELKYWEAEEDDDPFAEETTTVKEI